MNYSRFKALVKKEIKLRLGAFDSDQLSAGLRRLGIGAGDTLLVHSSYDAFTGFTGRPSDIIHVLQQIVGPQGSLMMPTSSFTGSAVHYAMTHPLFDVRRTPSCTGLITEVFRRSPHVVRSVHPTHSVAVWGAGAESLTLGHHAAATPCGKNSPYARLLERQGSILLLGVDIGSLTFYHMVEETIEPLLPQSPFTAEVFELWSVDLDGNRLRTRTRLFDPDVARRRNLQKLVTELKRRGAWRGSRIGWLKMTLLRAADVHGAVVDMAQQGVYCYD